MSKEIVDQICATFPGTRLPHAADGELSSWKVGDKMFACFANSNVGVSVKTANVEAAQFLIELQRADCAPYFHRSWVRIPWGRAPENELRDRLRTSYDLIAAKLPKKIRDTLV